MHYQDTFHEEFNKSNSMLHMLARFFINLVKIIEVSLRTKLEGVCSTNDRKKLYAVINQKGHVIEYAQLRCNRTKP